MNENTLTFHFSFFITMGVFFVVTLNMIFDYINYRGNDCKEERKDLLLTMRAALTAALVLPTLVVYTCRNVYPHRTAGFYLISISISAAIMNYFVLTVVEISTTRIFTKRYNLFVLTDLCLFLILSVLNDTNSARNKVMYWFRACLCFIFIITYQVQSLRYLLSIDIWAELSIKKCTRESIVLSVGLSPMPWVLLLAILYIQNGDNSHSVKEQDKVNSLARIITYNFFVIVQNVFLIICPERIARLLVTKMKGNVIDTANKLNHTIQPSILLLKRTISMLRKPQVMNATNNNEALKESYDNLAFACERVMKDIEELKKDELFSLNSNGGFIPNLVTVSEDRIMDHTEYEVMELPHYNTGGGRSVTGFKSPRRGDSNSNNCNKDTSRDVDGTIANDCNGNNFDMESDIESKSEYDEEVAIAALNESRPVSAISAISDDTNEGKRKGNLELIRKLLEIQQSRGGVTPHPPLSDVKGDESSRSSISMGRYEICIRTLIHTLIQNLYTHLYMHIYIE